MWVESSFTSISISHLIMSPGIRVLYFCFFFFLFPVLSNYFSKALQRFPHRLLFFPRKFVGFGHIFQFHVKAQNLALFLVITKVKYQRYFYKMK